MLWEPVTTCDRFAVAAKTEDTVWPLVWFGLTVSVCESRALRDVGVRHLGGAFKPCVNLQERERNILARRAVPLFCY